MIAGVDGTPRGWVALLCDDHLEAPRARFLERLADLPRGVRVAAVDVPIGLAERGRRDADCLARRALGPSRGRSVFPCPVRVVLGSRSWQEACDRSARIDGRRVSRQTFGILPKIEEADALLSSEPWARRVVHEAHPELSFARWSGAPMAHGKKTQAGRADRQRVIATAFGASAFEDMRGLVRGHGVTADDLADAFAVLWTASRILRGEAECLPARPVLDSTGLPMNIWT